MDFRPTHWSIIVLKMLLDANSARLNHSQLPFVDRLIDDLEVFLTIEFETPDADIDELTIKFQNMLDNLKPLRQKLPR